MEKKNLVKAAQAFCLLAFMTMALACSSYQESGRHLDNVRDAYNYFNSSLSDVQTDDSEGIVKNGDLAQTELQNTIEKEKNVETKN